MEFEEYMAVYVCILCAVILRRRMGRNRQRPRRIWCRSWLQRRRTRSCYNTLVQELEVEDTNEYKNFMRMTKQTFDTLLEKVRPYIEKQDTHMRKSISAEERLAVTLRFLATG